MANTADKVINYALSQVGYLEKSLAAYKKNPSIIYKFTDGAGNDNVTKYGKEMHDIYPKVMDFPAAWCDAFVDNCFYHAYGVANAKGLLGGDFDDYTKGSINLYKGKGAFFLKCVRQEEPGDQIFFSKDGTFNGVYHTGLVYKVDNMYVYTIEGNTSDSTEVVPNGGGVYKKKYNRTLDKIYGYGRPKYDKVYTIGWNKDDIGYWYADSESTYVKNDWKKINHHWYFFGNDGYMKTGAQTINGKIYYLDTSGDYEGACMKTDSTGALVEWYVD